MSQSASGLHRSVLATLIGALLAAGTTASEPSREVRWSSLPVADLSDDWQPGPLVEDLLASTRGRRSASTSAPPTFVWPLRQSPRHADDGYWASVGFVDHDPNFPGSLLDYEGGRRTYDLPSGYNHTGTDLVAWPFGWVKQALGQVEVVASAAGTIVLWHDGNFDRECDAGFDEERRANVVVIQHDDGSMAAYGHLKTGSLTRKREGGWVEQGEYLGLVGSSGFSGYPHLHFEVFDAFGGLIDPFAGPFNRFNDESWWSDQPPYYDTRLLTVMTHSAEPLGGQCPGGERTFVERRFAPGDDVLLVAYFRDLLRGQPMRYAILDPAGEVFEKRKVKSRDPHLVLAGMMGELTLPEDAAAGVWTYSVKFEGQKLTGSFEVGDFEPVRAARSVTPRNLRAGSRRKLKIRGLGFTRDLVVDIHGRAGAEKGVRIRRVKIGDKRILLTVTVDAAAEPGPRDIVITAPDYSQVVLEDALRVAG